MKASKTILVPFDFSKSSKQALDYTVNYVGRDTSIRILLAYVTESNNEDMLDKAFKSVEKTYTAHIKNEIEWLAVHGEFTTSILKIQDEEKVDLTIMGTFGGALFSDDSSETHTSKLVLESNCPVLVVPYGTEKNKIKNIGLVLGKEKIENKEVLNVLLSVARRFDATIYVLTIENSPEVYGYSPIDEFNENTLQYYLENFYSEHVFIENPDIIKGVMEYVSKKNLDLIAILPRNHAQESKPSKGKLTQMLTLHSQIPILLLISLFK